MPKMYSQLLTYAVYGFVIFVLPWLIVYFYYMRYNLRHGGHIDKTIQKYKKKSIIERLYYDFPKMYAYDITHRIPYEFKEYGVILICGEQGSGKSISVVELINRMKKKYPKLKSRSNIRCAFCDGHFDTWQELCNNDNGIYGQIEFIDEIHNWFSNAMSLNFPPAMLSEITQQRKQRKMIIGTTQVFSRLSKQLRQEATFVYCPMTLLGCLTIVRISKPAYYDDDKCRFKKFIKTYFFVHSPELRNAYDTYEKVQRYIKKGFLPRVEQLNDSKQEVKIKVKD